MDGHGLVEDLEWRATAAAIAPPSASHRRVEPSMSVTRNVTVPARGRGIAAPPGMPAAWARAPRRSDSSVIARSVSAMLSSGTSSRVA